MSLEDYYAHTLVDTENMILKLTSAKSVRRLYVTLRLAYRYYYRFVPDLLLTGLHMSFKLCIFKDSRYMPCRKDLQYDHHYDRNAGFSPCARVFK